MTFNMVVGIH